jgi:hypothetical protein
MLDYSFVLRDRSSSPEKAISTGIGDAALGILANRSI